MAWLHKRGIQVQEEFGLATQRTWADYTKLKLSGLTKVAVKLTWTMARFNLVRMGAICGWRLNTGQIRLWVAEGRRQPINVAKKPAGNHTPAPQGTRNDQFAFVRLQGPKVSVVVSPVC